MPISHKYKIIFVHIPKAGGSSVEQALGIRGQNNKGSLRLKRNILFGKQSWRFGSIYLKEKALQHLTAGEIKKEIGKDLFDRYFKCSFIRNPFDRVISDWFHMKRKFDRQLSLKGYLLNYVLATRKKLFKRKLYDDHFIEQHKFIYDNNGKLLVDFLGRFENMEDDWKEICKLAGLTTNLPRVRVSNHEDYKKYFDNETKALCENLYSRDLTLFNYKF